MSQDITPFSDLPTHEYNSSFKVLGLSVLLEIWEYKSRHVDPDGKETELSIVLSSWQTRVWSIKYWAAGREDSASLFPENVSSLLTGSGCLSHTKEINSVRG